MEVIVDDADDDDDDGCILRREDDCPFILSAAVTISRILSFRCFVERMITYDLR